MDSALKKDTTCYPQVFLEQCKYTKENGIRHVTDDLECLSDDPDEFDERLKLWRLCILINAEFWLANKSIYILIK